MALDEYKYYEATFNDGNIYYIKSNKFEDAKDFMAKSLDLIIAIQYKEQMPKHFAPASIFCIHEVMPKHLASSNKVWETV